MPATVYDKEKKKLTDKSGDADENKSSHDIKTIGQNLKRICRPNTDIVPKNL